MQLFGLDTSHPPGARYVFSVSMLILASAGIGLVVINTIMKTSKVNRNYLLTKALWKFEPFGSKAEIFLREQRLSFMKLLLAGIMINCLILSVLVKVLNPAFAVQLGLLLFLFWCPLLLIAWGWYVSVLSKNEDSKESPTSTKSVSTSSISWEERKRIFAKEEKDDCRIPLTIISGYLGSGKTTLLKKVLNNTIGMKVLVIENEIGTEGLDHDILLQDTKQEEIILMNNGCICCTGNVQDQSCCDVMRLTLFPFSSKRFADNLSHNVSKRSVLQIRLDNH
jgi:hypothetical protein